MSAIQQIHAAARKRQANWGRYPRCDERTTADLTRKLDELYAEHRLQRARTHHGDVLTIIRRARVEREIERLVTSNEGIGGR